MEENGHSDRINDEDSVKTDRQHERKLSLHGVRAQNGESDSLRKVELAKAFAHL